MSSPTAAHPLFDVPVHIDDARLVVLPVPFDATASYGRTAMERSWPRATGKCTGRPL